MKNESFAQQLPGNQKQLRVIKTSSPCKSETFIHIHKTVITLVNECSAFINSSVWALTVSHLIRLDTLMSLGNIKYICSSEIRVCSHILKLIKAKDKLFLDISVAGCYPRWMFREWNGVAEQINLTLAQTSYVILSEKLTVCQWENTLRIILNS